jgi:disulfide bond formation protein DsbB
MSLFNTVADVLGSAFVVWLALIALMIAGGLLGRLTGGFRRMSLQSLAISFLGIGLMSAVAGARFSEVLIGLIVAVLMVLAFIVGAAFAPHRTVQASASVPAGPWNPATGQFQDTTGYDNRGRPLT